MRLVDLDVAPGLRVSRHRSAGLAEPAPERRVDDAGAREVLHLLERVDRVEEPRVEGCGVRRCVVELVQATRELRDGRSA